MPRSDPFFDREAEIAALEEIWARPGAQLVTLWGRRRVGKSVLLSRFAAGRRAIYLYGTRTAERDLLDGLARLAAETLGDDYLRAAPFPTWDAALDYLALRARDERLLLVFDEFGYLCEATPGLDTLLQRWWDRARRETSLMVVVASSGFSFMQGLTGASGALHGRRTAQVEVHPFDYFDAASFFGRRPPGELVRAYACFGGMPAYLEHWDPRQTLAANVQRTLLNPAHVLFREGEELLRTEFHQEALYASILRAVAAGEHKPSDIARAVGRSGVNEILDHLRRLQELRLLRREVPVTEIGRARTQRALYKLADPYLRFWNRFVAPYQSFVQLGRGPDVWRREIAPVLDQFVASTAWEEVCAQYLRRRLAAGELPVRFGELGRWWDGKNEIDLVATWEDKVVLAGECKWTAEPVGERVFVELRRKAAKLQLVERPLWVLSSRSGFDPVVRTRAGHGDLLLVGPEDLFGAR